MAGDTLAFANSWKERVGVWGSGDDYMGVPICQSLLKCTLKINVFYCYVNRSQQNWFKKSHFWGKFKAWHWVSPMWLGCMRIIKSWKILQVQLIFFVVVTLKGQWNDFENFQPHLCWELLLEIWHSKWRSAEKAIGSWQSHTLDPGLRARVTMLSEWRMTVPPEPTNAGSLTWEQKVSLLDHTGAGVRSGVYVWASLTAEMAWHWAGFLLVSEPSASAVLKFLYQEDFWMQEPDIHGEARFACRELGRADGIEWPACRCLITICPLPDTLPCPQQGQFFITTWGRTMYLPATCRSRAIAGPRLSGSHCTMTCGHHARHRSWHYIDSSQEVTVLYQMHGGSLVTFCLYQMQVRLGAAKPGRQTWADSYMGWVAGRFVDLQCTWATLLS